MNGEVQLIIEKGGIILQPFNGAIEGFTINGQTVINLGTSIIPSPVFPCGDPNIITLVGGTITVPDADTNSVANIIGWDVNTCEITIDNAITWSGVVPLGTDVEITYYANGVEQYYIDLFENESISQNWKFQDLNNFTAQGAFSREFRVPYSDNNQDALGALFDVNVESGAENYFHYKLPAEIRVDTLPIATGYLRVRKVYKQMNRINEVELAFYAETPDLVRNIGEKKLADITNLVNLNEVVQYDIVTTPTSKRIWTLLERGELWSEGGQLNTRSLINPDAPVYPADLTPALRYDYLLEEIFADAGFELVGGSLLTTLSDYYMPWLNSSNIIGTDSFNNYFFTCYNSAGLTLTTTSQVVSVNTIIFDNNGDFNTGTYSYTTPSGGYYTFRFRNQYRVFGQINNVSYFLQINGTQVFLDNYNVFDGQLVDFTYRIAINAGSVVKFMLKINNISPAVQLVAGDGTYETSIFEVIKTEFFFDQGIIYNLNAPDAKQIDFVTDIIKMHNCAIVPDRAVANKVYLVPQNSYLGSGNELDWTDKLDVSKDITISSTVDLQKAKTQFTYTLGEDVISQQYKNVNRVYGDYQAVGYTTNPNILPSDFAIGEQKISLVHQSTPCGVVNASGVIMPMFINSQLEFVAPGMRCLFDAGTANIQLYDDGIAAAALTVVPLLNHYSQVVADIDDYDLNWAPEVPPYSITASPYNNLFNQYWRTYMNALYSPEARLMEASFALDLKDILTFQFSDKIWIKDSWWRIIEINDYKVGMNESTQVKLLKFLENTEDCSSTPVSITTNGKVNFVDGNGDPVLPTQDCCTRYGYNWDETVARCWAFIPNTNRPNTSVSGNATTPATRPTKVATATRSITNSIIEGNTVTIADGNSDMLAVGTALELTKNVQGSNLIGKNVYTNLPGIHIGGGYKYGNPTSTEKGWAQTGIVILHVKDTWLDLQTYNLNIEGIPGEFIVIPNDTVWSCIMNVTILDTTTNNYCVGQYLFGLQKIAFVTATPITVLNEINGTPYTFLFGIDTGSNPAESRINLQISGLGFSSETFIVTASLQYQQNTSI
jgi:hypothetical protein